MRRCCVSCVTRASNWYWLTAILLAGKIEGEFFISSVSSLSFLFLFLPCSSLSSLLLSLFSLSLGDDTKWPTRVDVSLNLNTIKNTHSKNNPLCTTLKSQWQEFSIVINNSFCYMDFVHVQTCGLNSLINDNHADNNLKEILVYVLVLDCKQWT